MLTLRFEIKPYDNGRGYKDLTNKLIQTTTEVGKGLRAWAYDRTPQWTNLAVAMVKTVVYDVYTPQKYRRNYKLAEAIVGEVNPLGRVGMYEGYEIVIRNDTARVQPTHPKGGTTDPVEVPWEIEEGRYPQPWFGYTAPRPYMAATAAVIDKALPTTITRFVDPALRTFSK